MYNLCSYPSIDYVVKAHAIVIFVDLVIDQHLGPLARSSSRQCNVQLAMSKDGVRQIEAHFVDCLTLGFVDRHGKLKLNWELASTQLERQTAFTCHQRNTWNCHNLAFVCTSQD